MNKALITSEVLKVANTALISPQTAVHDLPLRCSWHLASRGLLTLPMLVLSHTWYTLWQKQQCMTHHWCVVASMMYTMTETAKDDSPLVCSWHLASASLTRQGWQPARCSLRWQYGSSLAASSSTACSAPPSEETPHRFWPGSIPGASSGRLRSLHGLHPRGVCLQTGAGVSRGNSSASECLLTCLRS